MSAKQNRVRIIAGQWGGRKITFPNIEGLRPTTDPIRETLFNWLQTYLPQSNCLDLYAGSGSLGFEAASRRAKNVIMVENNLEVNKSLRANKDLLKAEGVQVVRQSALSFLQSKQMADSGKFDVVFLDPPFKQGELPACVKQLEQSGCLSDDAVIYLECERKLDMDFLPEHWVEHRSKTAGQVAYYLYHRELS